MVATPQLQGVFLAEWGGENPMKTTLVLLLLCVGTLAAAQSANSSQSDSASQHPSKKTKGEVTVRGCLGRSQTDYILTQPEQGNSYELERSRKLRLGPYLGQEVEVTGTESPSMSTSSDFLARAGSASPVTIRVTSIKTISKRCSAD
jgi:hypothetical protein